jgi:hypothetical protein
MNPIVQRQFSDLKSRHAQAELLPSMDGNLGIVHVPNVAVSPGWSKLNSSVWFVIPAGYAEGARPDCFWADTDLRLANGAMPNASNMIPVTGLSDQQPKLWFSWHIASWNPNSQFLYNYLAVCENRFRSPQ